MSKCISKHGEYSEHNPDPEQPLICDWCGAFDEEAALEAMTTLARVREVEAELRETIVERRADAKRIGPDDRQAFLHLTAGLSEAHSWLAVALTTPAPRLRVPEPDSEGGAS